MSGFAGFGPRGRASLLFSVALFAGCVRQAKADALNFFKNYFVTGDYVVGGVALRGQGVANPSVAAVTGTVVPSYATGTISMSGPYGTVPGYTANGIPQHADIVAAYLYWETIAGTSVDPAALAVGTFRGYKIVGTQLAPAGVLACSGSGGGSGNQSGSQPLLVFRADVLRYLPYKKDPNTGRPLSQRLVNDADLTANNLPLHTVSLPDSGGGGTQSPSSSNQAFLTEGASLVVVYRISGQNAPLRSVVLYDGGFTFSSNNPNMTQNLVGFYQASTTSPSAKMTHIVGDGDAAFKEALTVNGNTPNGVSSTNAFQGALGQAWDNLTFDVSNLMSGNDGSITTQVTPGSSTSTDCLSWGAIVFSTTVQDSDGDGLLDIWETTLGGATAPGLPTLPDLKSMGANPAVKDIFLEIDYMCSNVSGGVCIGGAGNHNHLPTQAALDNVGAAFAAKGIKLHFDVGANYPGDPYVIPSANARGGDIIAETSCGAVQTPTCLFPAFPGTVAWKDGFQLIRDGKLTGSIASTTPHFDHNRKDIFHYALFAHALGLPKWRTNDASLTNIVVASGTATVTTQLAHGLSSGAQVTVVGAPASSGSCPDSLHPCLNGTYSVTVTGNTTFTFPTTAAAGTYTTWSLAISNGTPRSNSGISDIGGGDLMVTLGLWDNSVGSDFMQASTLLHELGHNLDLGHGGDISDPANCKPNYQSSMSYLFQVRGLLDPQGNPHIDYSGAGLGPLNESSLNEAAGLGNGLLPYLPRWYAPKSSSFLDNLLNTSPAKKHCDGTPVLDNSQFVRIDGTSLAASPIDWNGDGSLAGVGLSQDINFNGAITNKAFQGFNDWANINLQQVGARRNGSATSGDIKSGQDNGDDQGIAGGDLGIAGGDLGIAGGDLGIAGGDLGIAGGDLGIAGGDLGIAGGDLGGELDFDAAQSLGNAANALSPAVVGFNIDLKWTPPNVGSVTQYQVWRATCPKGATLSAPCSLSPSITPVKIGTTTPGAPLCDGSFNFCDTTTKNNTIYLYFVTATFASGTQQGGASNIVAESR